MYKKRVSEGVSEGVNEGVSEGVNEGVSEGVNAVLDFIAKKPGMRTPQIAIALDIPQKTIERWLSKLKRQARVQFKGSTKTGGYYMTDQ